MRAMMRRAVDTSPSARRCRGRLRSACSACPRPPPSAPRARAASARRGAGETRVRVGRLRCAAPCCSIAARTAGSSASAVDRLRQEVHRAGLDRLHRHRDVAVTGEEDDRQRCGRSRASRRWSARPSRPGRFTSSTRHPRHWPSCARAEEGLGRAERLDAAKPSARSSRDERPRHRRVVVDDEHGVTSNGRRSRGAHRQRPRRRSRRGRSCCAAVKRAAVRLDDRPADREADAHAAGLRGPERDRRSLELPPADPGPESRTPDREPRGRLGRCAPTGRASVSGVPSIASAALTIRFSKTCCNCTRLACDRREAGERSPWTSETWRVSEVGLRADRAFRATSSLTSTGRTARSPRWNSAPSRRMTCAARLSSETMSSQIARSSSRSTSSRPQHLPRGLGVAQDRRRAAGSAGARSTRRAGPSIDTRVMWRSAARSCSASSFRDLALGDVDRDAASAAAVLLGATAGGEPAHLVSVAPRDTRRSGPRRSPPHCAPRAAAPRDRPGASFRAPGRSRPPPVRATAARAGRSPAFAHRLRGCPVATSHTQLLRRAVRAANTMRRSLASSASAVRRCNGVARSSSAAIKRGLQQHYRERDQRDVAIGFPERRLLEVNDRVARHLFFGDAPTPRLAPVDLQRRRRDHAGTSIELAGDAVEQAVHQCRGVFPHRAVARHDAADDARRR